MVSKLKNNGRILRRLYEDPVSHVEEISLIEEDYLWQGATVYVDDLRAMRQFLVVHSPTSYPSGKSLSAYMTVNDLSTVEEFASILEEKRDFQTHLETSVEARHVRRFMPWLTKAYTVRYCKADLHTFKPTCQHRERTIRLTARNVRRFDPSASAVFVKRLQTAPVFGYLDEKRKLVATSGIGFLTKKSFSISYTETDPEFRGRGIAKCLTSLASEPLIKKGLIGVYAADISNKPSLGVAHGLGFEPHQDLHCFYN